MGVILGFLHLDGKMVSKQLMEKMMDKLNVYRLDKSEVWVRDQIFLVCGIQYITEESLSEKLPYHDFKTDMVITADAIIDNRAELLNTMGISTYDWKDISDSQLILMAYKKWGKDCPKHLIGDFAFAIWNIKEKELFCARDHVGKRTLYFYHDSNMFVFSTVMRPLLAISEKMKELNDSWISDFLSIEGVAHELDYSETVYKNIHQLQPAYTISLKSNKLKKERYWYPLKTSTLRLKSDAEYEEAFREIFFRSVHDRLRCVGKIGVMLSGGLDSSSVASIAASQLAKKGMSIQAYSAIPFSDYKDYLPKTIIADETPYIECLRTYLPNMEITYCRSEGKHSLTDIERFISILEQPYKIIQNLFWIDEILRISSEDGCKVLLNGQYGNSTISYGDFTTHIVSLFRGGRFRLLQREIDSYCKLHELDPIKVRKIVSRILLPYSMRKLIWKVKGRLKENQYMAPINPELANKWGTMRRLKKSGLGNVQPPWYFSLSQAHKLMVNPVTFSHIGAINTKLSLAYGAVRRDPTMDKRVIEFCLSLPGEQYVREGHERYLIQRSMVGLLPDKIRLNTNVRGRQSADWLQRLSPHWDEIKSELESMLQNKAMKKYIDIPKLNNELIKIGNCLDQNTEESIRMLLISLVFEHFLNDI